MPHNHTHAISDNVRLSKLATAASLMVATSLICLKTWAWWVTDSLSLFSSLIDSLLDVASSLVNFIALRYALLPADEDHRFGHGKAEDVASMAQATFITGSGVLICFEGAKRFMHPEIVNESHIGIVVMIVSMVLTIALVIFQRYVIRQSGSGIVKADALHYMTDIFTNASVIAALVLYQYFDIASADPLFALAIAAYILYNAWGVGKEAFDNLMDKELSDEERQKIIDIVNAHSEAHGLHDLRTRRGGMRAFIQFHLDLGDDLTLRDAHRISDNVEMELMKTFPHAEIIIHQDPISERHVAE